MSTRSRERTDAEVGSGDEWMMVYGGTEGDESMRQAPAAAAECPLDDPGSSNRIVLYAAGLLGEVNWTAIDLCAGLLACGLLG